MSEKPPYNSYLEELAPFENASQEKAVIKSHLKGLKGQLETLKSWGDDSTELNNKKYFKNTFGNPEVSSEFEGLYKRVNEILSDDATINREAYDEVYKKWEIINKHIGN